MNSSSELKRREKAAKKEQERLAKEAAKAATEANAPKTEKKKKETDVDPADPQEYFKMRERMIESRRAAGDNPFPHKFNVSISLTEFREKYKDSIEKDQVLEDVQVSVAGESFHTDFF